MTSAELIAKIRQTTDEQVRPLLDEINTIKSNKLFQSGGVEPKEERGEKVAEFIQHIVKASVYKDYKSMEAIAKDAPDWMSVGTNADGGFVVPTEFEASIFRIAGEYGIARRECLDVPMANTTKDMPYETSYPTMNYVGEGEKKETGKLGLGKVTLVARTAARIVMLTNDLIADTPIALTNYLTGVMAEALALREDTSLFLGNGGTIDGLAGTSGVLNKVASGANYAGVEADDIIDMLAALSTGASRGAKIYCNKALVYALAKKKNDTTGEYLITKPTDPSRPLSILGYPIVETDVFPAVGAATNVVAVVGNLRNAYFGNRSGVTILPSDQATIAQYDGHGALEDVISAYQQNLRFLRFEVRHDFKPAVANAFCKLTLAAS